MTPEQLAEIRQRAEQATPPPWENLRDFWVIPSAPEDAEFIAHARTDIPALLAEVDRLHRIIAKELTENDELGCEFAYVNVLRAEVKRLREALDKILIKVDWNSDEFHSSKQYNETRQIILAALNPKELVK